MNLETQIRRTLMSFAVLAAFGTVAVVQGESLDAAPRLDSMATTEACASTEVLQANDIDGVPEVEIAPVVVRLDWRARLPAAIASSRS